MKVLVNIVVHAVERETFKVITAIMMGVDAVVWYEKALAIVDFVELHKHPDVLDGRESHGLALIVDEHEGAQGRLRQTIDAARKKEKTECMSCCGGK